MTEVPFNMTPASGHTFFQGDVTGTTDEIDVTTTASGIELGISGNFSGGGGGGGVTLSGSTNNTVATVTGANALIGEANLTFDGSTLKVNNTGESAGIGVNVRNSEGEFLMYTDGGNFIIKDYAGSDTYPFKVMGAASNDTLVVNTGGAVAVSGTLTATAADIGDIQIRSNNEIENDSSSIFLQYNTGNDVEVGSTGTNADLLVMGRVGIAAGERLNSPDETLHVIGPDSGPIAKFERDSGQSVFIGGGNGWGNIWTDDAVLAFGVSGDYGSSSQMRLWVNSDTAADAYSVLELKGNGNNYTNAGISLLALDDDASYRGLGVFMHDAAADHEWYMGTPYSLSDSWMVSRQGSVTGHTQSTSDDTRALMIIRNDGDVGIGTTSPTAKLEVAGDLVARRTEITDISGNTNLLGDSHAGRLLRCTSACTLSLQATPTAGEQQVIYNDSSGTITIAANGSDTINGSTNDITITSRYKAITVIAVSASAWLAIGA